MSNEIINYDGVNYEVILEAEVEENHKHPGNACYSAMAVKQGEEPDEYGTVSAYSIRWAIPELTEEQTDNGVDVCDLIDWDNPDDVAPAGGYQIPSKRFI